MYTGTNPSRVHRPSAYSTGSSRRRNTQLGAPDPRGVVWQKRDVASLWVWTRLFARAEEAVWKSGNDEKVREGGRRHGAGRAPAARGRSFMRVPSLLNRGVAGSCSRSCLCGMLVLRLLHVAQEQDCLFYSTLRCSTKHQRAPLGRTKALFWCGRHRRLRCVTMKRRSHTPHPVFRTRIGVCVASGDKGCRLSQVKSVSWQPLVLVSCDTCVRSYEKAPTATAMIACKYMTALPRAMIRADIVLIYLPAHRKLRIYSIHDT